MTIDFATQYGPWAVVAGASEGVGSAFALAVAQRGVNVVLLARRQTVLDEVAQQIVADTGVDARALAVDLAEPAAMKTIVGATADLEVGLFMYCAGADPRYEPFLTQPVDTALAMLHRNCVVPTQLCHHFGAAMVARHRGGIILVSSAAALVGGPNLAVYAGQRHTTWCSPSRCGPICTARDLTS